MPFHSLPLATTPGFSRLFLDFCSGDAAARPFFSTLPEDRAWLHRPAVPAHWPQLIEIFAQQNPGVAAQSSLGALKNGAGIMVTGQQVGLLGGPLYSPLKAATAVARARQATEHGAPHVPVFWMATEDHDFAEINHVVLPGRRELRKLVYNAAPAHPAPVGNLTLRDSITAVVAEARELLGVNETTQALEEAYQPGRTLAQAFAHFYARAFAAQGLLIFDPSGREAHRLGASVLRAALERADEFHAALLERNQLLQDAGYHTQVAVGPGSSLLFLLDEQTDARTALKREAGTASEPGGLWRAGKRSYSTSELLDLLAEAPERISTTALLRPIFQDFLFSSSAIIGGPAEIAYFAQSAVLYERILGRMTPALPRFTATLLDAPSAQLLHKHSLELPQLWGRNQQALTDLLGAQAIPAEGRQRIDAAGQALEAELARLLPWMHEQEPGLGRSAETAASKMRYQMSRLRRLAANHALAHQNTLAKEAGRLSRALAPAGHLQERTLGAAAFYAAHGFALSEQLVQAAVQCELAHAVVTL